MRRRLIAILTVAFILGAGVRSQTSGNLNHGLILAADPSGGTLTSSWWGEIGKAYYIQHSTDMVNWDYFHTEIQYGADQLIEMGLQSSADRGFFRLVITDDNALPADWLAAYGLSSNSTPGEDPDGDGVTNALEYRNGTNPNSADTDGDGLSDSEEATAGTNPNDPNSFPAAPAERVRVVHVRNSVGGSQTSIEVPTQVWVPVTPTYSSPDDLGDGSDPDKDFANADYQAALAGIPADPFHIVTIDHPPTQEANGKPFTWSIDFDELDSEGLVISSNHLEGQRDDGQDDDGFLARGAYEETLDSLLNNPEVRNVSGNSPTQEFEGALWIWSFNYEQRTTVGVPTGWYAYEASQWNLGLWPLNSNAGIKSWIASNYDWDGDISSYLDLSGIQSEEARDPGGSQAGFFNYSSPLENIQGTGEWFTFAGVYELAGKFSRVPAGTASAVWLERVPTGFAKYDNEPLSMTCLKVRSHTVAGGPEVVETITPTTLTIAPGHRVSASAVFLSYAPPADMTRTGKEALLPIELYTDLNNDGKLDAADAALVGKPYEAGATDEEKAKGTEYMFANDEISNGASDREDTTAQTQSEDDDDAEGIHIKVGMNSGKVWLEHPAIASLSFYSSKQCYPDQKIQITEANPFDLAGPNPLPETIYARCDQAWSMAADTLEAIGDLVLKFLPIGGGQPIQAATTRGIVVKELGSTEHHNGAMDYINEKKTTGYTGKVTAKGTIFSRDTYYTVMFETRTQMYGINAAPKALKGITAVKDSADWKSMTAIINATYNYDNTNENGFVKKHLGEQYIRSYTDPATSTHWDQTCSVKVDPITYLAYGGAGVFANGSGHVPVTASDGAGALRPEAAIASSPEGYTLVAFIQAAKEKLIVVAASEWSVMSWETAGKFHERLKKGATSTTIIHCDGGRNVALASANDSGTGMVTRIEGPSHQGYPNALYPKTYLAFKATPPPP